MTIWTALILGLLIGWIVEWVIDWIYWRQRTQNSTAELENLRSQNSRLRADINVGNETVNKLKDELTTAASAMTAANADRDRLRAELADANGEIERLRSQPEARERMIAVGERTRDPLIDINGIGPVYEQRLFDAGIYTFADLAAQSPARLRELVGAKSWQETETEAWIAEAQQFIQAGRRRSVQ